MSTLVLGLSLFAPFSTVAQENEELAALREADQAARQAPLEEIDWAQMMREDAERRTAVLKILKAGGIRTAADHYNAALILQHGQTSEDTRLAHALATISAVLAEDPSSANWLQAASWDRLVRRFNQPQWYGTQYVKDDSGKWVLYEVLPGVVSDEQRAAWSVPSLEEARKRAERMNTRK